MITVALVGMGVFFVLAGWGRFGDQDRFFKNSYTVPGVVTEVVEQTFEAGTSQRQPRIQFKRDDGLYEFDAPIRAKAHGLWPEKEVQVNLSPDFPNVAMLKLHQHQRAPLYMIIGVVLIAIGLFFAPSMIEAMTDAPMMSLMIAATIVGVGVSMIGPFRQHMSTYYGLSDNIRHASGSELPATDPGIDALSEEETPTEALPRSQDRPEPVALETYGAAIGPWPILFTIIGVILLAVSISFPWPFNLAAILPAILIVGSLAFLTLRKRRKYWDSHRKSVITATRWPGKEWRETSQPIKGFVRVEIQPVSSSSSSSTHSSTRIWITVIHKDDDFMLASGKYSWPLAYYSSYSEREEAENFASQVAFTLDLPLVNKLY